MSAAGDADLAREIEARLDRDVRPRLTSHLGGIELVAVNGGAATLRFTGSCAHCPGKATTTELGVRPFVEAVAGVDSMTLDNVWVSRHAQERLRKMARRTVQWASACPAIARPADTNG